MQSKSILKYFIIIIILVLISKNSISYAATEDDKDYVLTTSIMLGEAQACEINTKVKENQFSNWINKTFNSKELSYYISLAVLEQIKIAKLQREGKTIYTCIDVNRIYKQFPWPWEE